MTYGRYVTSHPFFWAALTGLALGVAIASATRNTHRATFRYRAASRKWTATTLLVTAAVVFATLGIFVPEGTSLVRLESAYVAFGALVVATLAFRFPRAGGIPAFLLIAAISLVGPLVMQPFVPVRGATVAASVHVLAADETGLYAEIDSNTSGSDQVVRLPTDVVAVATTLTLSDYLFFFGASGGVRFDRIADANAEIEPLDPYSQTRLVSRIVVSLPLTAVSTVSSAPVKLALLRTYDVIDRNGEIVIEQRSLE